MPFVCLILLLISYFVLTLYSIMFLKVSKMLCLLLMLSLVTAETAEGRAGHHYFLKDYNIKGTVA